MFWVLLAVEIVGLVALFVTLTFFQEGQVWEHRRGAAALSKTIGLGAAIVVIVVFGFGLTDSLSVVQIGFLFAPMLLLILMFAALVDQPYPED